MTIYEDRATAPAPPRSTRRRAGVATPLRRSTGTDSSPARRSIAARPIGPRKTDAVRAPLPTRWDGSKLLCVYLFLQIAIPSDLVLPGLGAAGSPALLFGVLLFVRWLIALLQGQVPARRNVLHWALLLFTMACLASYLVAQLRPLDNLEVNSADRALIRLVGWSGVLLTALDGLPTRQALRRVLVWAGLGGLFLAVLGLIQSFTGFDVAYYIQIPGLHPNNSDGSLPPELRNGIARVQATTSHPIEFATVLVLLIALVAPLALRDRPSPSTRRWFVALIVMGLAFPQAVARSGFLAAAVLAVVVIPGLPSRQRKRVLIALPFGLVAVHFLFPSLLGTIIDMFGYTADGQEVARTGDYPVVFQYFMHSPIFGHGFGTMINTLYRTLDNQIFGTLDDAGLFGLLTFLALHALSVANAANGKRLASTADDRMTGTFLMGAPIAAAVSSFTFDSLSFPMFAGLLFLIFGLSGAYVRVVASEAAQTASAPTASAQIASAQTALARTASTQTASTQTPTAAMPASPKNLRLRWATAGGFSLLAVFAIAQIHSLAPTWITSTTVAISPGRYLPLTGGLSTPTIAGIMDYAIQSDDVRADLLASGARASYTVAQTGGSLEPGTDVLGDGPVLEIQTQSKDPAQAESTAHAVVDEMNSKLAQLQIEARVPVTIQALVRDKSDTYTPGAAPVGGKRAYAAVLLLAAGLAFLTWTILERLTARRTEATASRQRRRAASPRHRLERVRE